jgi:hypothetical protein
MTAGRCLDPRPSFGERVVRAANRVRGLQSHPSPGGEAPPPSPRNRGEGNTSRLAFVFVIVFLAAPVAVASPSASPDAEVLAAAEAAFSDGVRLREDSAKARPAFARAAAGYDELWRRGFRDPDLALNRGHARRLAGDLPGAIVALNEGLAAARWSRPLQVALEDARSAVAYPRGTDLAAQCRPSPAKTVGTRMSPTEGWAAAALLWLVACAAVARFAMTRAGWWLAFAGLALAALAVLGGLWLQDARHRERENAEPLLVVADDVFLRKGNSANYPYRLEPQLPKGVEARELTRRGGWVQVRLASGAVGWLPETSVLSTEY